MSKLTVDHRQLPVGWVKKRLGDICSIKHGFAFKSEFFTSEKSEYVLLTPGSFYENGGYREQGEKTKYYVGKIPTDFILARGSFLFVMTEQARGLLGSSLIVPESNRFLHNQRLGLVQVFDGVEWDNNFFFHQFNTQEFRSAVQDSASGLKVRHTSPSKLGDILIRFPPSISDQKAIASIVDQAFEAIDVAIENTKQNLANARELFESYLNAVFDRKGDGWIEKKLGDVCIFQGGSQPPKSSFSAENKEGYIRLIQIRDYKSDKYIVYILRKDARRFCQPDDVMIGRYGPPLFQILRGIEGAYNVALMKAIPDEDLISKDFLFHFLKNKKILSYVINSSSRTAGQTGLNKATIEPYPIAFPSLEKQAIIVTQLQELKAETQRLEAIYRQKLAALTELKQSILQKAFTGELTANQEAP
jgi:type I restriction enzyme, S subunit